MSVTRRVAPAPSRRTGNWSGFDQNTVPGPTAVSSGSYRDVTDDAFRVAAVVACVGMRAGAFAQLPLRGFSDEGPNGVILKPQPDLFVRPSSLVVPAIWKTQMSISRDVWGYAAGQIRGIDAAGYVSNVDWVCPDIIKAWQDHVGGPLRWKFGSEEVDASMVFHVPSRWVKPGEPLGMSPLESSGLVELAKRAQDFGRNWFLNGAVPSAILYSDKELDSTQADDLLAKVVSRWRKRQPAVIGSGMKYEKVSVNANESQFIETMRQVASDIAISFNLPPERIGAAMGSKNEYSNIDMNQQQYLLDSINPDLVVIQEVFEWHMRPGTYARWQTGAFLRADLKTRYLSYQIGLDAGFLVPNEPRAWEELPPLPESGDGGDEASARDIAEVIQKLYLGGGVVLTADEARAIVNRFGANLVGSLPSLALPEVVEPKSLTPEPPVNNVTINNYQPDVRAGDVHVAAAAPAEAPIVNVTMPEQQAPVTNITNVVPERSEQRSSVLTRTVVRDTDGRIARIVDEVES